MEKKHFCFFQTAETGNRTLNSGVKGSGANHYPRAPAPQFFDRYMFSSHFKTQRNVINPYDATIFFKNHGNRRVIFNLKSSQMSRLAIYGSFEYLCYASTAIGNILIISVFIRQNLKKKSLNEKKIGMFHSEDRQVQKVSSYCCVSLHGQNTPPKKSLLRCHEIAMQRQTAVTAYLKYKQLLLFVFARRSACQYAMAEENPAAQRQTTVTFQVSIWPSVVSVLGQRLCLSWYGCQYASTRWQKRILQLKDKQQ